MLGVECDGAYYHSARSARERDRLRAEVLGTLGWKLHRIWSTDWWLDPDREMTKLEQAIRAAVQPPSAASARTEPAAYAVPPMVPARAAEPAPTVAVNHTPASPPPVAAAVEASDSRPYRIAEAPAGHRGVDDFYDPRREGDLRALVEAVVTVEAPVSLGLLVKRIASFYGIPRTSARVTTRVQGAIDGRRILQVGEFLWRQDQAPDAYRAFRVSDEASRRDATDIPIEEVANAAAVALRRNVALPFDELVKQTARVLGFGRTGGRVAERMGEGIELLITRGVARRDGDKIRDAHP
ncbi:MAG: DUF3320 domain-containing protein [Myxococcales bacterium]|nr:DUF3320 domain-containing protein [Myxococcales bacterium]